MTDLDFLVRDLPSPEAARRFFEQFAERNASQASRVKKNDGLFSDILTLASYSPLLSATLLQNPGYVAWLDRRRSESSVRGKEELLESLARFALTNSQLEPHVLLARFRRRELLRIFLRDLRRLSTIAEVTEEISNLADAILENAIRLARQEMDNRYGPPFEKDDHGRMAPSDVCVVSLGKLGSKELNYSSDIDLLFIYSADGSTTGGARGTVTNREYFVKLAENVTQLVGKQSGEGAAYRVDMRLRPHGRVGSLALSLRETTRYYLNDARSWEQQVLIRSRASAGSQGLYREFFNSVEAVVFRPGRDAAEALREVRLSKEKIDLERRAGSPFDVKLGRGGIREIEFIAQALQLAHGGSDRWLRAPHTLISISRLADRGYLSEDERSSLSNAYDFLRRLEHILQMEHGLQTHALPSDLEKVDLISAKMMCTNRDEFERAVSTHTANVHAAFRRVFGEAVEKDTASTENTSASRNSDPVSAGPAGQPAVYLASQIKASVEKLGEGGLDPEHADLVYTISVESPKFGQMIASRPRLIEHLRKPVNDSPRPDYAAEFSALVDVHADRASVLSQMREVWSGILLEIAVNDIFRTISIDEVRTRQTLLAEVSIETAMRAAGVELSRKHGDIDHYPSVLALGKLGSGTLDYDSDLDLLIAYQDDGHEKAPSPEVYSRMVESFVNFLSAMTRDGNLYRVDLRLRPHGKNGPNVTSTAALQHYIENSASIWELLAFVQLRAVPAESEAAHHIESAASDAIKRRVEKEDHSVIKRETRSMRMKLEEQHGSRDMDIKFGSGGLLDVYFVTRYLQLTNAETVPAGVRTTAGKLEAFYRDGTLAPADHVALSRGHEFLSALDHNIRLNIGRSSKFPRANRNALGHIANRMGLSSVNKLTQQLTLHRIGIREAFKRILSD